MSEPSSTSASPSLSGWRLWLAWAVVAAIAVWGIVLNVRAFPLFYEADFVAETAFEPLHITPTWNRGVPVRPQVGGVAEAAGLPAGRLVSVDGRPLAEDATLIDAGRLVRGAVGDPVRLAVATESGDTVEATVVRSADPPPDEVRTGVGSLETELYRHAGHGFSSLVLLITAVVLLARRGRSLVALVAAAVFLAQASLSPPVDVVEAMLDGPIAGSWILTDGLFVGYLFFFAIFPNGRVWPHWALWVPVIVGAVAVAVALFGRESEFGLVAPAMLLMLGLQWARYRRVASEEERLQTKWAVLGAISGFTLAIAGYLVLVYGPAEIGTPGYRWWRILDNILLTSFVLFPIGVLLSLLRYRLWDAEAAWSRSAMAAVLTLTLTAIVAGGSALTEAAFGASGPWALGMATAAAAVVFVPLQRRLSDWADHRFLRELTELREHLPELVGHLRETESVEGIADAVADRVAPAVHATRVAIVVPRGDGWQAVAAEGATCASVTEWASSAALASPGFAPTGRRSFRDLVWRQPTDARFPLRVALRAERGGGEVATEGWLVLGPRPDGSGYGPDELEAIAAVAGPVGRALQVVRVREARAADLSASLDALRAAFREELRSLRRDLSGT